MRKALRVFGIAKRNNSQRGNLLVSLYPIERFIKLFAIVDVRTQNNLAMNFNASIHELLENFNAPGCASTNQIAAHVR